MSYVYKQSEPGCYTVGFYAPDGGWNSESDHPTAESAALRVAWLNGGRDINEDLLKPVVDALYEVRDAIYTAGGMS